MSLCVKSAVGVVGPKAPHEVRCGASGRRPSVQKGLMTRGSPRSCTTIPLDCKVDKRWFQGVSLPD